jgi:2-keto-4-pentenoate hydratase/2-oxohepta-3-ene-1,7-dioic acid hydratase in catechol pathway
LPPYPSTFIKANTCLNDHGAPITIPKIAQDEQADYEGELCFVISRDALNVPESDVYSYIGGYFCGNDVSSRKLQRDPKLAGTVPQWNFSKGFDSYAPLGPQIVSPKVITDPTKLWLKTIVNGDVRQSETIDDFCFKIPTIVSYCSQGTTLKKGTVIMTGTPSGEFANVRHDRCTKAYDQFRCWIRHEKPAVFEAGRCGRSEHRCYRNTTQYGRVRLIRTDAATKQLKIYLPSSTKGVVHSRFSPSLCCLPLRVPHAGSYLKPSTNSDIVRRSD